ncbi:MAG: CBS domain-containing protein [Bacillota bacterium]
MVEMKKVEAVMVSIAEYPVIYGSDSLDKAIIILKNNLARDKGHRSLMVFSKDEKVNGEEKLIGIFTVGDILRAMKKISKFYSLEEMMDIAMSFSGYDRDARARQERILREGFSTKVGDNMRPLVDAFLQQDQDITDAIRVMLTNNVHVVPVFSGKKAVGVLRAIDILDYIGDMLVSYTENKGK